MNDAHRLSRIETLWSVVQRAHGEDDQECCQAQQDLLDRYAFAVRRYLQAALRDETAVDEVFQEFAMAFVRGDYRSADPGRGRFRNFLKTILFRLVADFRRTLYRRDKPVGADPASDVAAEIAAEDDSAESDQQFLKVWRESLLGKTWGRLEDSESETGQPFFTVLRFRVDHPDLASPQLAEHLTIELGKPISAANARVLLHRAREKFTQLLIDEILPSLQEPTLDRLEEELIDLGLISYCREVLDQRRAAERQ